MSEHLAIERRLRDRLARLAADTRRPDEELANEALELYLDREEWAIREIRQGIAEAERGDLVPDEQVQAWVEALGSGAEPPLPQSGKT